jgi:hypothetical protein
MTAYHFEFEASDTHAMSKIMLLCSFAPLLLCSFAPLLLCSFAPLECSSIPAHNLKGPIMHVSKLHVISQSITSCQISRRYDRHNPTDIFLLTATLLAHLYL